MQKRVLAAALAALMLLLPFFGCASTESSVTPDLPAEEEQVPQEDLEEVKLVVVGAWTDFRALEIVADRFTEEYPNCTIEYEYVQDYYASLEKRMSAPDSGIDLFITDNIQAGSQLEPFALELYSQEALDLSGTYEGLIQNFMYRTDDGSTEQQIYAIPLGAELRGMYVNKTLLAQYDLSVPTNQAEFLNACQVLAENGFIPVHGNPGRFGQQLLYPYCCNLIANADDPDAAYEMVNSRAAGVSELFRAPMEFLYTLVSNGYYKYKYVETELGMFTDDSDEGYAKNFLNLASADGVTFEKKDDIGVVAFMPATMSLESQLAKIKEDYHSEIEYEFILSPVGEEGGYAYLSPAHGIAINKDSEHVDWAVKFLNFFFTPEINILFAEAHHITPNTKDALELICSDFSVSDKQISQLGQVTFDYDFYTLIYESLLEVSKGNNPKYMQEDGTMYSFDYYMERLESRFAGALE